MKSLAAVVLLSLTLLATAGVSAEGPQIPDEATKACALKKAYHMNGDSMVGWGSIDLSKDKDPCPKTIRVIPIKPDQTKKMDKLR